MTTRHDDSPARTGTPETEWIPAEKIEGDDPVLRKLSERMDRKVAAGGLQIPRDPESANKILDLSVNPEMSIEQVIRQVRTDPALAGKLMGLANSAVYSGAEPALSLKMAVIRLGLKQVSETALELSASAKDYHDETRNLLLARQWGFALATGLSAEELAARVTGPTFEGAFLAGLFHAVAAPAIVRVLGRLEMSKRVPRQSDARVLGLLDQLSSSLSARIVQGWNLPEWVQEAIRLQDAKSTARRQRPLAQLLVCAKAVAADLGFGTRPGSIDFKRCRDFWLLRLDDDRKINAARAAVLEKMKIVSAA